MRTFAMSSDQLWAADNGSPTGSAPPANDKAARLAAIRAANAQKKAEDSPSAGDQVTAEDAAAPVATPPANDKAARLAAIRAANAQKAGASAPPAVPAAAVPPPAARPAVAAAPVATAEAGLEDLVNPVALSTLFGLLFAAIMGAFAAVVVLPTWLPGLTASLLGTEPKAYWYLARSSGLVAYGLLWLATALGLTITSKLTRLWNNGPTVLDLHQYTSLLALAFGLFHALILLGDAYMSYTLVQVLMAFGSQGFRPVWVGLGQLALYLLAVVGLSFYVRSWIGRRAWRLIHYLSFGLMLLALLHGIGSGTDTAQGWIKAMYWASGGSLVFLTIFRVLITATAQKRPAPAQRPRT